MLTDFGLHKQRTVTIDLAVPCYDVASNLFADYTFSGLTPRSSSVDPA